MFLDSYHIMYWQIASLISCSHVFILQGIYIRQIFGKVNRIKTEAMISVFLLGSVHFSSYYLYYLKVNEVMTGICIIQNIICRPNTMWCIISFLITLFLTFSESQFELIPLKYIAGIIQSNLSTFQSHWFLKEMFSVWSW